MWHWLRAIHRYSGELGVPHAIIVIMLLDSHAVISAVNQISSEHGNHSLMGKVERASRCDLACWCLWQLRRRELTLKRCQRLKVDILADLTEHLQGYRMVLEMSLAACLLLPDAIAVNF